MVNENDTNEPSMYDSNSSGPVEAHRELYFMTGDRIPGHRVIDSHGKSWPSASHNKPWVNLADIKNPDRANDSDQPEPQ